jgi:uncharacterized protein
LDLKNKHIWITGASRGIGLALAQSAVKRGGIVHLCLRYLDEKEEARLLSLIPSAEISFHQLDMNSRDSIENFCQQRIAEQSIIDIWVNNAGLLTGGLLENQEVQDVYSMYQVNLIGPTHVLMKLIPLMESRPEAVIVNNASVSGIFSLPCASTYAAAKSGLVALTRSLEVELKGSPVRTLTLITPGIKTRMFDEIPKLYGEHLDISALSSIPASSYAEKVWSALENGKRELWPRGSVRVALWLSKFMPSLFNYLATTGYRRKPTS